MRIIGYIVTDKKMNNIEGFVKQVDNYSEVDPTKPVLIVGWDNAKSFDGYKSILDKQLNDNTFWTFKRSENRSDFEDDLKKFYSFAFEKVLDDVKYYYVNVLGLRYSKLKKLYDIFNSSERKNIYINNGIIYVLYNGKILGVSLEVLEYCGIRKNKVLTLLGSNPNNHLFFNTSKGIGKLCRFLDNKKYAIPYFITT